MYLYQMEMDSQERILLSSSFWALFFGSVFLAIITFAIIGFPSIVNAADGGISGRVFKYSSTTTGISGIQVEAYDINHVKKGTATTNSTGNYTISPLAPGNYFVKALGSVDYVGEYYECSSKDCGYYFVPEGTTPNVTVSSGVTKTGINFYLTPWGRIQGNVDGIQSGYDYNVIIEGFIKYKDNTTISLSDFPDIDNNHYTMSLPPGEYTVKVTDNFSQYYPYYHDIYYQNEYTRSQAYVFTVRLGYQDNFANIDFHLQKGATIKGNVMNDYIDGIRVTAIDQISGYSRYVISRVETYLDPNKKVVRLPDSFDITGLPSGSYILKIDDFFFQDPNYKIYLQEYYHETLDDIYLPSQATQIPISAGQTKTISRTISRLDIAPAVRGWAIKGNPGLCGSNQYSSANALEGIRIEITPDFPWESYVEYTDSAGRYYFPRSKKMPPGSYRIRAIDTSFAYFPSDFQYITLAANAPAEYNVYFCLQVVQGSGNGTISGKVFLEENPAMPLNNIKVAGVNIIDRQEFDFNYVFTGADGVFHFQDLEPGEYIVFTDDTSGYTAISLQREVYKDITILDGDVFEEGTQLQGEIEEVAEKFFLYPGEGVTGINIGLSSYKYTFGPGLNLFGYPGTSVKKYDYSYEFCAVLGLSMDDFRWKDTGTGQWHVTRSNPSNPGSPLGSNIQISTGMGYLIYMDYKAGPFFFPPYKVQPPESYQLAAGRNLIAYPSSYSSPIKRSFELLSAIGMKEDVASIKSFSNTSGKWSSTQWIWGRPGGANFSIKQGEGYIVDMYVSKSFVPNK
ncbi:hypothetical protein JXL19_00300 [bacterium]|nr:hypothetical protein [bacterium]